VKTKNRYFIPYFLGKKEKRSRKEAEKKQKRSRKEAEKKQKRSRKEAEKKQKRSRKEAEKKQKRSRKEAEKSSLNTKIKNERSSRRPSKVFKQTFCERQTKFVRMCAPALTYTSVFRQAQYKYARTSRRFGIVSNPKNGLPF
jgi:hypothetical protein